MPAIYNCTRLHAKLSLQACEANRAKGDDCIDDRLAVRPGPCRTCTDWKTWGERKQEDIVTTCEAKPRKTCPLCGSEAKRFTKGVCHACYQRQRRASNKSSTQPHMQRAEKVLEAAVLTAPVADTNRNTEQRIYLACPYTHTDAGIMQQRQMVATTAANALLRQGKNVFSPISHGAAVGKNLPVDFSFWGTSCLSFVECWATDVFVLMLPGWENSTGVRAEMQAAAERGIPITRILPLPMEMISITEVECVGS